MTAAIALTAFGFAALGVAVIVIGSIIVLALEFGQRPIFSAAGVLYAGLPAVALLWLRSSEPYGLPVGALYLRHRRRDRYIRVTPPGA